MGEKLWPNRESSLAISVAFFTGLDIERKIGEMVKSVADQKKGFPGIITWANGRISYCKSVIGIVTSFIKDLNRCSKTPYFSVMSSIEGVANKESKPYTEFELLFDPPTSKSRKVDGVSGANFLDDEIAPFQRLRHATAQQLNY